MKKRIKSPALEQLREIRAERRWKRDSIKIAVRVLESLRIKGWSQADLAKNLGTSPQWVNKIVKAKQNLTIGTIRELEEALGIKLLLISDNIVFQSKETHTPSAVGWDIPFPKEGVSVNIFTPLTYKQVLMGETGLQNKYSIVTSYKKKQHSKREYVDCEQDVHISAESLAQYGN